MYLTGVENLRREFPEAAFTTDILTGFPGETEEEYAQTRHMIEKVGFAKIHVFPYSRREGTKAAAMPGQLSNAQKELRARELIALGEAVGRRVPGRICGPGGRSITGRAAAQRGMGRVYARVPACGASLPERCPGAIPPGTRSRVHGGWAAGRRNVNFL